MTRNSSAILDSGDAFPALAAESVAHGPVELPDYFGEGWGVLLIYRAHW